MNHGALDDLGRLQPLHGWGGIGFPDDINSNVE